VNRLLLALAAYAALGILSWTTLNDSRVRLMTLLILGLFTFKTVMRRKDVIHGQDDHEISESGS
jgi:PDZ domain-containing secreted protein